MAAAPKLTTASMTIASTMNTPPVSYVVATNDSGVYAHPAVRSPETYSLTVSPGSDSQGVAYLVEPSIVCQSSTAAFTTQGQTVTRDFGFVKGTDSWYQVIGGNVMAESIGAPAVQSYIPTTCTAPNGCTPYVLRKNATGTTNSSGYAVVGKAVNGSTAGQVITANTGGDLSKLSEENNNVVGALKRVGFQENYDYFANKLYSMGTTPTSDFSSTARQDLQKPNPSTQTPVNPGRLAYYADGDTTINTAWTIPSAESIVIFVHGNLTINKQITVANGGFLAFIASGNVTIDPSLGTATSTSETPLVEGVYIADGTFTVDTKGVGVGDDKFIGAGTFVGWSGVNLLRDYRTITNSTKPVELFVSRPDFAINAPTTMKKPLYTWQEAAP